MQSVNFNGSCKNDNFQSKYFVLCFLFLLRNRLWKQVRAKIRKMCTPVNINMGCKGYKSLHRRVIMLK